MMDKHQVEGRRLKVSDAQWPPKSYSNTQNTPIFYRVANENGVKKIAWPPRVANRSFDHNNHYDDSSETINADIQPTELIQYRNGTSPVRGMTPTPAGIVTHPLRETPPVQQSPVATVQSHPFIRSCTPTRKMGDQVWPPKKSGCQDSDVTRYSKVPLPDTKPKRQPPKDYKPLFSRHRIPSSCPVTYWVPPGTQHFDTQ